MRLNGSYGKDYIPRVLPDRIVLISKSKRIVACYEWELPERIIEYLSKLSPQRKKVLILQSTGKTNREISLKIGIKERSVAKHITKLRKDLGVSSSEELTVIAVVSGLLTQESF